MEHCSHWLVTASQKSGLCLRKQGVLTDISTNVFKLQYRKVGSFQMHQWVEGLKELAWGGGTLNMIFLVYSPQERWQMPPRAWSPDQELETFAPSPAATTQCVNLAKLLNLPNNFLSVKMQMLLKMGDWAKLQAHSQKDNCWLQDQAYKSHRCGETCFTNIYKDLWGSQMEDDLSR